MADAVKKTEARVAAETIQRAVYDGSIAEVDMTDVSDLAAIAASATERFGDDAAAALDYYESVMANYFDTDFSNYVRGAARASEDDVNARENSYISSLMAASDMTPDEMNRVLAWADAGVVSGLRKAEEAFYYS